MSKLCLIVLLVLPLLAQIMALEAMAHDPQSDHHPISGATEPPSAEAPGSRDIRKLGKHHSGDKSVAGGGVIIGGLVTATFAAVFCYIRVTRKRDHGDQYITK